MDKFLTTDLGGIPESWDDLRWYLGQESNQGIYQALNNIQGAAGTDYVVQGCVVSGTAPTQSMTEGWIVLSGELMKVVAISGTLDTGTNYTFTKVSTTNTSGDKTMQNAGTVNSYQENRGVLSGGAGSLNILTGVRLDTVYGAWKTFDMTGNVYTNTSSGGGGTSTAVVQGPQSGSYFKYRLVGKTVDFKIRMVDVITSSYDVAQAYSIVIDNLPFTAADFTNIGASLVCESHDSAVSNTGLCNISSVANKLWFNNKLFRNSSILFNLQYTFDTTPSMLAVDTGNHTTQQRWTLAASGTIEIA